MCFLWKFPVWEQRELLTEITKLWNILCLPSVSHAGLRTPGLLTWCWMMVKIGACSPAPDVCAIQKWHIWQTDNHLWLVSLQCWHPWPNFSVHEFIFQCFMGFFAARERGKKFLTRSAYGWSVCLTPQQYRERWQEGLPWLTMAEDT